MANILGISMCGGHDTGAAIIRNGVVIAAVEEEKLNRIKHYSDFPLLSIRYCLKAAGLAPDEIDNIGISWHPTAHLTRRIGFALCHGGPGNMLRRARFVKNLSEEPVNAKGKLSKMFPRAKIKYIEHHMAHAASAYYSSPYNDAAIFTVDGRGEWATMLMAVGEEGRIRKIKEQFYPVSIGLFFVAFTHYLGFETNDEYKVMGLSSYGKPKYMEFFRKAIKFSEDKIVEIDEGLIRHPGYDRIEWGRQYYTEKVISALGKARRQDEPIETRYMDIAASLQARLNEVGVDIARHLHSLTHKKYLCLAGGVALNGVMNYKIKTETPFEDIFIQPAAGDGGLSLGSALYVKHMVLGNSSRSYFRNAYLGPEYSDQDVLKELRAARLQYIELDDPASVAANLLKEGNIIGWFQGRTEFGPRALGNRSILADPRKGENKDIVNARIKFREEFRPFAPSVLEECADDYFVNCNGSAASYMVLVNPVRTGKDILIPAVTHVDKTSRVQVVIKDENPLYYALIKNFQDLTGIPVILNTSFNVKGEPIVNSPTDAIRCFFSTGLDYLVINRFLLSKSPVKEEFLSYRKINNSKICV